MDLLQKLYCSYHILWIMFLQSFDATDGKNSAPEFVLWDILGGSGLEKNNFEQ